MTITSAAKADLKGSGLHQKPGSFQDVHPGPGEPPALLCACVWGLHSCLICPCLIHPIAAFSQDLLNVKVIFVVPAAPFLEGWDWKGREMAVLHI